MNHLNQTEPADIWKNPGETDFLEFLPAQRLSR
jgi:hypothetical protein